MRAQEIKFVKGDALTEALEIARDNFPQIASFDKNGPDATGSDRADFERIHVPTILKALIEAYEAGRVAGEAGAK